MATQIAARLLIQTGRGLLALTQADLEDFRHALTEREQRHNRALKHDHSALYATRAVLYHLGADVEPSRKNTPPQWGWEARLAGVPEPLRRLLVAYLECCMGTRPARRCQGWPAAWPSSAAFWPRSTRISPPSPTWTASGTSSCGCTPSPRTATATTTPR